MSQITLHIRPRATPLSWEEFCATHPPYAMALDGYVVAGPRFDPGGPRVNMDHHTEVDRLATRATCAQVLIAIRQGLFQCFRDEGGPRAEAFVNDCDEDVCTAWFLLKHAECCEEPLNPPLNRLVAAIDLLDTTAGAYPFPATLPLLEELAWVFAPYRTARQLGDLDSRDAAYFAELIAGVEGRIHLHLLGEGGRQSLDTRYSRLGGGPGWAMIQEVGAQARTGVFADEIRAYVSAQERGPDRWSYIVGRMSPFIPFDVPAILRALNEAEGTGAKDGWGGSNIIGGSPRSRGSGLPPAKVAQIVNDVLRGGV